MYKSFLNIITDTEEDIVDVIIKDLPYKPSVLNKLLGNYYTTLTEYRDDAETDILLNRQLTVLGEYLDDIEKGKEYHLDVCYIIADCMVEWFLNHVQDVSFDDGFVDNVYWCYLDACTSSEVKEFILRNEGFILSELYVVYQLFQNKIIEDSDEWIHRYQLVDVS